MSDDIYYDMHMRDNERKRAAEQKSLRFFFKSLFDYSDMYNGNSDIPHDRNERTVYGG